MEEEYFIKADSYDFDERISAPVVFVLFYDHMDNNCRGFECIIEEVPEKYNESVVFLSVDIEQSPDIAFRYSVESVPYVILFSDGVPVSDVEGANLPDIYMDMIESAI